jgi:hypothetical protein
MKSKWARAAVASAAAFAAGQASAYAISYGNDGNGRPSIPLTEEQMFNSLGAQTQFFKGNTWQVENFENQATNLPPGTPLTLTFGTGDTAVSATLAGGMGRVVNNSEGATDGRYSVPGGSNYWTVPVGQSSPQDAFTITFNDTVAALGFFGIDIGDLGVTWLVELL